MNFLRLTTLPVLLLLAGTSVSSAQAPEGKKTENQKQSVTLDWANLEKAAAKATDQNKPILLDVYTDWCGWCKKMDKEVFVDPAVAEVLTARFSLAKVNGESKESFTFKGQKTDGIGIARKFGVRGYPSIIFLDSKGEVVIMVPGYLNAEKFLPVTLFVANREYEKMKWEEYLESYNKSRTQPTGSK